MPAAKSVKIFDACQVVPPSILYCKLPCPPDAITVKLPSFTLQSVGFEPTQSIIAGPSGAVIKTGLFLYPAEQLSSLFLT